jgi:6-phosphogluconolactonase
MYINRWLRFCIGLASLSLATPLFGQFVYVASVTDNTDILGYAMDSVTGVLTLIPGSPFHGVNAPRSLAADPKGEFLYVTDVGSDSITGFGVDATTGRLTALPGSPFPTGPLPLGMTVDPSGRFAYAATGTDEYPFGTISGHTIDSVSGALAPIPGSPFLDFPKIGEQPISIVVHPTGKFAIVTNGVNPDMAVYAINAVTGALTPIPGSPFPGGGGALAVDPTGKFAYTTSNVGIFGYTINAITGALTQIDSGIPFPCAAGGMRVPFPSVQLPSPQILQAGLHM